MKALCDGFDAAILSVRSIFDVMLKCELLFTLLRLKNGNLHEIARKWIKKIRTIDLVMQTIEEIEWSGHVVHGIMCLSLLSDDLPTGGLKTC
jgi:hypothetical protein